ncbi:hypothetical protein AL538_21555 [Vibrio harveyi]|uniref:Sacsin/Nov domain-containing protein n=1 Tax=Vibrio harveyi TaxID=669 RepID=A0ABN4L6P5_VIBHA|nr:hypothetical protein [Vibrio harveyi]AMG00280.1 hypothetical protein AL538_21555 [Vibrio harveyi]
MAGASIDAIGVINQIKDNLTDRYEDGFPVLKEIIQNADDAGANELTIGWSKGFCNAENELLNAPALFFINDAPLAEEHRDAILSIAQSSKATSKASVGKFGLGMKSLFHMGEAFFFMSDQWRIEHWASDVFNPWDKYRDAWNEFGENDKCQIATKLKGFLSTDKPWFVVWVPLRTKALAKAHNNYIIINNFSGDEKLPSFFNQAHLSEKTSEILPQLKNLKDIGFFCESDKGVFDEVTSIQLHEDSSRSSFCGEPRLNNGDSFAVFSGKIYSNSNEERCALDYAGCERVIFDERLNQLKDENMGWPKSYQFDKKANLPVEALDKAEQHASVTFSRFKTKGQAYLKANWAVFLPLSQTKELVAVPIEGEYDYNLYLHGYFFVDAGRKGLHGHDNLGFSTSLEHVKNDEKKLREVWNIILASEGTFNLVLPALNEFCQKLRLPHQIKTVLTKALYDLLIERYRKEVSKSANWIINIDDKGAAWSLLDKNAQCLPIPRPENSDYSRIWSTLPGLSKLLDKKSLYEATGNEFLTEQNQRDSWNITLLEEALGSGVVNAFYRSINIEYLLQFLQLAKEQCTTEDFDNLIIPQFREVLSTHKLAELSLNKALNTQVFELVSAPKTVVLPIDKDDQSIWELVCKIIPAKLLLPKFLSTHNKPIHDNVTEEELFALLTLVDSYIKKQGERLSSDESSACERLITFVIDCVNASEVIQKSDFYQKSGHLKLLKVEALGSQQSTKYRSLNELIVLKEKYQLFLRGGERNFGKGLGKELVAVVPGLELCFISKDFEIGGLYEGLTACSEAACLRLLSTYPNLGSNSARLALTKVFSAELSTDEEKRGFRYLIHGSKEDDLRQTLWKPNRATNPVWMKIWRMCQPEDFPGWCELDEEFSNALTNQYEHFIGVKEQFYKDIISEYRTILPECNFDNFDDWEVEQLLADIGSQGDERLWKALPVHRTAHNTRVAITTKCLMEGSATVPSEWDVHLIQHSAIAEVAACQHKWVNHGLPKELIEIALTQSSPAQYSAFILDQLCAIRIANEGIEHELEGKINNTKWLRLASGTEVSPEAILSFSANELPESAKFCELKESNIYMFSQLDGNMFEHDQARGFLREWVAKSNSSVCSCILAEAAQHQSYVVGNFSNISAQVLEQISCIPPLMQLSAGWGLLVELYQSQYLSVNENKQVMLCKETEPQSLWWALERIADDDIHGQSKELRKAFLEALCNTEGGVDYLPKLRFRNENGSYVSGNTLVSNVAQVVADNLISPQEYAVIESYCSKSALTNGNTSKIIELAGDNAPVLSDYFDDWEGMVPPDAIATFIALFAKSGGVEKLVNNYLRQSTLESIKQGYEEKWNSGKGRRGEFSHYPYSSLYKSVDFELAICAENAAYMTSIFGERIQVKLQKTPDSLLVHQANKSKTKRIELRRVDTKNVSKDQLLRMLAKAVETIFTDVFGAECIRFESEFLKRFGASEQVDIQITRQIVLENVVPLLERLQVREEGLCDLRSDYKREQRVLASSDPSVLQDRSRLNSVLTKIKETLENNEKVQSLVLESVRKEMSKHFQYSPFSVPFELFQNADDALCELIEMQGDSTNVLTRFDVVSGSDGTLNFYHWGREVNYCKSSYVAGKNQFDRDLEKMVSLNVSDKSDGKTGKFGLGFKSSLLLTDIPRLVSGDICAEIHAGVLPSVPSKPVMTELNQNVDEYKIGNRKPTLIQLPKCDKKRADLKLVLGRFKSNAGILTVFSRQIREINIDEQRFGWSGQALHNIPEVLVGEVKLPTNTSEESNVILRSNRVLIINTESGQFLFALDSNGVVSLSNRKNLSSFWVLNPIDEDLKLGFCINAPFAVDIGRSQLAVDNGDNIDLSSSLGKALSAVLVKMFAASSNNWNEFAEEVGLGQSSTFIKFWASLWDVITAHWPARLGETNSKAELIKQMFTVEDGLLAFYQRCAALPRNLGVKEDSLVQLKNVDTGANKPLTKAFNTLGNHPILQRLYKDQQLVGHDTFEFLKSIDFRPNNGALTKLELIDLIGQDFPHNEVNHDRASFYGRLFGKNFEKLMSNFEMTVTEKKVLEERFSELKFLNKTGVYVTASKLIVEGSPERDLLSKFAPDSAKLSEKYDQASMDLVSFIRRDVSYDIHSWAKQIRSEESNRGGKQEGLCSFLVEGGYLASSLLRKLQTDHPAFLTKGRFDPSVLTEKWRWSSSKASAFISIWIDTEEDKARHVRQAQKEFIPNVTNGEQILENITNWWNQCRNQSLIDYDKQLYAQPMPWKAMTEDFELETLEVRKGWLKLFYLGSCQTLGFNNDVANRNVVSWFEDKGWWDKLAVANGPSPEVWKELMEEYLQTARVDERYRVWIQVLPLYRFATKLKDYVALFMNASFIDNLDDLLKPNSSNKLSGSGIQVSELKGTLGIGINFILRELQRHQVLEREYCEDIQKYAFVLPARLRKLLKKMGAGLSFDAEPENSERAYDYFVSALNSETHPLLKDFDIPFRVLLADKQAFERCFNFALDEQFEEVYG